MSETPAPIPPHSLSPLQRTAFGHPEPKAGVSVQTLLRQPEPTGGAGKGEG